MTVLKQHNHCFMLKAYYTQFTIMPVQQVW